MAAVRPLPCLFLGLRLLKSKGLGAFPDNETGEPTSDSVDLSSGGPSTRRWKRRNPRPQMARDGTRGGDGRRLDGRDGRSAAEPRPNPEEKPATRDNEDEPGKHKENCVNERSRGVCQDRPAFRAKRSRSVAGGLLDWRWAFPCERATALFLFHWPGCFLARSRGPTPPGFPLVVAGLHRIFNGRGRSLEHGPPVRRKLLRFSIFASGSTAIASANTPNL